MKNRKLHYLIACGAVVLSLAMIAPAYSQPQSGEQVGSRIGRTIGGAIDELASEVREGFAKVRSAVDRLGVEGRVYARLHWDKQLNKSDLAVDVRDDGSALLTGTVPSDEAKAKAARLAEDTVGVKTVVNNIRVVPPAR